MRTTIDRNKKTVSTALKASISISIAAFFSGCTGQLPGSFRLAQQDETFATAQNQGVNTKLDMLWVIDNSASMDVSQKTLRNGFSTFAKKYLKPTWDIRVAAITSDAYLANPAFTGYLNSTVEATNYQSTYLGASMSNPPGGTESPVNPYSSTFHDPSYANWTNGTINSSGKFTRNTSYNQLNPNYGPNWALLLPKLHDGPMPSLCFEDNTYFFFGEAQCFIRDNSSNRGPDHCLNPQGAEDSTTQCVNTFNNDTIHSMNPIVSTLPPAGTAPDDAWVNTIINNFTLNLSTGTNGSGSERGFSSVLQMMKDNELAATRKANANPFFRPNSLRVIVFVSDEDDQSISLEATDPMDPAPITPTQPFSGYIQSANNCPIAPNSPQTATCCATKTVDGYTYLIPVCPVGYPAAANSTASAVLMPVNHVKAKFDAFFQNLDGLSAPPAQSSYFVASIVLVNGASIQTLREQKRCPEQIKLFGACNPVRDASSDRGDRYLQLATLVGNGSSSMDISSSDYSPILDLIGQSILLRKSSFTLQRAPTSTEEMVVRVLHADASYVILGANQFSISDKTLTITDQSVILGLGASDQISINYQPKTLY